MEQALLIASAIQGVSERLSPLTPRCQIDFGNVCRLLTLPKGAQLVRQGQLADKAYFILSGGLRAFYLKDGRDITDWFAFEHEVISAINSFYQGAPSAHYIETLEPATLLEISRADVQWLANEHLDFDRLAHLIAVRTLLQLQQRVVAVQFETAQQKYDNLLQTRPDVGRRVPLRHIASYLGITLETLSRVRRANSRI